MASVAGSDRAGHARGCVLLVLTGNVASRPAVHRAAQLAAGQPVVVLALARGGPAGGQPGEDLRRAVAETMSVLSALGVTVFGHVAATRSAGRTVARAARARSAGAVVLDLAAPGGAGSASLAAEIRRRMHGSGLIVASADAGRAGLAGPLVPR